MGIVINFSLLEPQASQWLSAAFSPVLGADAVFLNIDCPGGSPAATELLHHSVRRYAESSKIPVFGFAQSMAASGGCVVALHDAY